MAKKSLPLELRWRLPSALPDAGGEVEVAFCRFLEESMRLTVRPVERRDLLGKHHISGTVVPLVGRGWEVFLNDERLPGDMMLSFQDACYAAWAAFVEMVPGMASLLVKSIEARSTYEGWDRYRMEVFVDYAYNVVDSAPGAAGVGDAGPRPDPDSAGTPGDEPGPVWPLPWSEAAPGDQPLKRPD